MLLSRAWYRNRYMYSKLKRNNGKTKIGITSPNFVEWDIFPDTIEKKTFPQHIIAKKPLILSNLQELFLKAKLLPPLNPLDPISLDAWDKLVWSAQQKLPQAKEIKEIILFYHLTLHNNVSKTSFYDTALFLFHQRIEEMNFRDLSILLSMLPKTLKVVSEGKRKDVRRLYSSALERFSCFLEEACVSDIVLVARTFRQSHLSSQERHQNLNFFTDSIKNKIYQNLNHQLISSKIKKNYSPIYPFSPKDLSQYLDVLHDNVIQDFELFALFASILKSHYVFSTFQAQDYESFLRSALSFITSSSLPLSSSLPSLSFPSPSNAKGALNNDQEEEILCLEDVLQRVQWETMKDAPFSLENSILLSLLRELSSDVTSVTRLRKPDNLNRQKSRSEHLLKRISIIASSSITQRQTIKQFILLDRKVAQQFNALQSLILSLLHSTQNHPQEAIEPSSGADFSEEKSDTVAQAEEANEGKANANYRLDDDFFTSETTSESFSCLWSKNTNDIWDSPDNELPPNQADQSTNITWVENSETEITSLQCKMEEESPLDEKNLIRGSERQDVEGSLIRCEDMMLDGASIRKMMEYNFSKVDAYSQVVNSRESVADDASVNQCVLSEEKDYYLQHQALLRNNFASLYDALVNDEEVCFHATPNIQMQGQADHRSGVSVKDCEVTGSIPVGLTLSASECISLYRFATDFFPLDKRALVRKEINKKMEGRNINFLKNLEEGTMLLETIKDDFHQQISQKGNTEDIRSLLSRVVGGIDESLHCYQQMKETDPHHLSRLSDFTEDIRLTALLCEHLPLDVSSPLSLLRNLMNYLCDRSQYFMSFIDLSGESESLFQMDSVETRELLSLLRELRNLISVLPSDLLPVISGLLDNCALLMNWLYSIHELRAAGERVEMSFNKRSREDEAWPTRDAREMEDHSLLSFSARASLETLIRLAPSVLLFLHATKRIEWLDSDVLDTLMALCRAEDTAVTEEAYWKDLSLIRLFFDVRRLPFDYEAAVSMSGLNPIEGRGGDLILSSRFREYVDKIQDGVDMKDKSLVANRSYFFMKLRTGANNRDWKSIYENLMSPTLSTSLPNQKFICGKNKDFFWNFHTLFDGMLESRKGSLKR